jgi:hypothetical protein
LAKVAKTKDVDDHRVILKGEMDAFADKNKIELDSGLFYSKEAMDDMVRVRMNGTEGFPSLRSAERGCSIFADFPCPSDAIESLRLQEHAAEISQANHTFEQALKLAASDGRTPPETYMEMRLVIGTYAAKLWALWRSHCHHFQKVFAIYNTLLLPEVMAIKAAFTPKLIPEIIWAIFDDGRCFFNQRKSPEDLARTPITWPTSTLDDILLDVRFARTIFRATFPDTWKVRAKPSTPPLTQGTWTPGSGTGSGGRTGPARTTDRTGGNEGRDGSVDLQKLGDALAHIHKDFRKIMKDHHLKYNGDPLVIKTLNACNLKKQDLPKIPDLWDETNKKSNVCWSHLLGRCTGDNCYQGKKIHWQNWKAYVEPLRVDPYLQGIPYSKKVRCLTGFAGRVRRGGYGSGRKVKADTVSTALTSIGQEIALACEDNPTKHQVQTNSTPESPKCSMDGERKTTGKQDAPS